MAFRVLALHQSEQICSDKGLMLEKSAFESLWWPIHIISTLVGDHRVKRSDKARNIGVVFDETLSLDKHVSSVCKSALFHLWNIAKIRMYLTSESTRTLVYAYVTCRLDNCNSLLLGSPQYMIQKLQRVQNCAARLVAG